jgi:hypothetical protein
LGSSRRDKIVEADFLGQHFLVERRGTDGDICAAADLIRELDGHVAAIGLGGIDLYLVAGKKKHVVRDALRLAQCAKITPVVDGSGLKNTLERETIGYLSRAELLAPADGTKRKPRVLVVSAVDRFGMAEALELIDCDRTYGDLIFALKVPIAIHSLSAIRVIAALALPILCRLPFQNLYPIGGKQTKQGSLGQRWFEWADAIGGDYHFIGCNLPAPESSSHKPLAGKLIITNTTTADDVERLRALGLARLVTTTPRLDGRSFGTNVMEGVLTVLSGKSPADITEQDYLSLLRSLDWEPQVDELQGSHNPSP